MNFIEASFEPLKNTGQIKIHSAEEFEGMRVVGQKAAQTLDLLSEFVRPGVSTQSLDDKAVEIIQDLGAVPAPLNYRGFRRSICTSINHVVCHGIPSEKILRDGDIMNVDVTLYHEGWHGDHSRMYGLGDTSVKAQRLMDVTYDALMQGIQVTKPGATLGDIGHAIQAYAELNRMTIVRDFCGHGLGRIFHDTPNILHYGRPGEGLVLREGMFFTIEPMLNLGKPAVKILGDGWTAVTRDRTLSAQFEHSVGVTATGCEIFTKSLNGSDTPHRNPAG
ncbi:MAG: type I methionyl aminopeptidase [Rhodobiaceae bacterium]|jgi:methionyl aminopeptidase|nr:type I methionyl aminopeptidase [Rhodobiaceae bacterium]